MRSRFLIPPFLWATFHLLSRDCLATISGFAGTSDESVDYAAVNNFFSLLKQGNDGTIETKVRELLSKFPESSESAAKAWIKLGLLLLGDKAQESLGFDMEGSSKTGADSTLLSADMLSALGSSLDGDLTSSRSASDGSVEKSQQAQRNSAIPAPTSTPDEGTDSFDYENVEISTSDSSGHSGSPEQESCENCSSGESSGPLEQGSCCEKDSSGESSGSSGHGDHGGHSGHGGHGSTPSRGGRGGRGNPPGRDDHSGKGECCGKGDSCGMSAYFVDSYKSVILFSFWKTFSFVDYYASLLLIFILSLFTVSLKVARKRLTNAYLKPSSTFSYAWKHLVLGAIAFIVTFMDFCMMLIVMTFNVGIVLVVCAGYAFGYVLTCYTFVLIDSLEDEESPIESVVDCC